MELADPASLSGKREVMLAEELQELRRSLAAMETALVLATMGRHEDTYPEVRMHLVRATEHAAAAKELAEILKASTSSLWTESAVQRCTAVMIMGILCDLITYACSKHATDAPQVIVSLLHPSDQ